jgi:uncharacterized membrane protein
MRTAVFVAALLAASAALAQPAVLPSLFDVAGIAPTEVLNIRGGPDVSEPVIGRLAADARDIEVVALDPTGVWGLVNAGERAGWVALRFLREQPEIWRPGSLPAGLVCLGTEPFWSLRPEGDALVYDTPEAGPVSFPFTALDIGAPDDVRRALVAGETGPIAAITPRVCSDGMSDRAFGLEALLILGSEDGPRLRNGCCSIAPRAATVK